MAALNAALLNTLPVGSGAGSSRVPSSGAVGQRVVGTLTLGSFAKPFKVHRPLLLNAWLGDRPLRISTAAALMESRLSAGLSPSIAQIFRAADREIARLSAVMSARALVSVKVEMAQSMAVFASVVGDQYTTSRADEDRVSYVPAMDRTSYAER